MAPGAVAVQAALQVLPQAVVALEVQELSISDIPQHRLHLTHLVYKMELLPRNLDQVQRWRVIFKQQEELLSLPMENESLAVQILRL
jgi:hypothetical protein